MAALDELTAAWHEAMADPAFTGRVPPRCCASTPGVPSLLYDADAAVSELAGARILLKREDLNHTGAHKIRNVLGQALLTRRMGKTRVIAETGAGQHGVATATAAAYLGLDCMVYMGEVDTERQALNVARMQLLGAEVVPVDSGSARSRTRSTRRSATGSPASTTRRTCFGTAAGPHPFPSMVRDFAAASATRRGPQCLELTGALPDAVDGVRRRRVQRDRAVHRVRRRRRRAALRLRGGRRRRRHRAARRDDLRRRDRRAARRPHLRAPGRGRPDHGVALDLRRPRLPRRRSRARPPRRDRPRDVPRRSPTPRRWTRSRCSRAPRGSSPRSSPRTPSPARSGSPRSGPGQTSWSTSPAAATRTWAPPSSGSAWRDVRGDGQLVSTSRGLREGPGGGPRGAGRLPAGRLPRRARRDRGAEGDGRRRLRRDRGRPALLRPGDGRPDDPGRGPGGARGRRAHDAT